MIKNIMNLVRKKYYPDFIFPNSFNLYAETFNTHSDTTFYFFCIYLLKFSSREILPPLMDNCGNLLQEENTETNYINIKRNKIIDIYLKSKKIKCCLLRFLQIIKNKKNINYEFDQDLQFIPLKKYDNSEKIIITQNKTNYEFRLMDLIKLWKIALFNSQNMFPMPLKLKNPFTNMIFSNSSLFNIFYKFQKSNYVIPEIILMFYKNNFDMDEFKVNTYPTLQKNAIKQYISTAYYQDLYDYLVMLFHDYRKETCYVLLKPTATYLMKQSLIKKMKWYLKLYLTTKFSCNPLLKDLASSKIKKNLNKFILKNSFNNFIYLTSDEIDRYENNPELSGTSNENKENESKIEESERPAVGLQLPQNRKDSSAIYELLNNERVNENTESQTNSNYVIQYRNSETLHQSTNNITDNSSVNRNYINGNIFNNNINRNTIISRRSSIYIPPINNNPFIPRNEIPRSPSSRRFDLLRLN